MASNYLPCTAEANGCLTVHFTALWPLSGLIFPVQFTSLWPIYHFSSSVFVSKLCDLSIIFHPQCPFHSCVTYLPFFSFSVSISQLCELSIIVHSHCPFHHTLWPIYHFSFSVSISLLCDLSIIFHSQCPFHSSVTYQLWPSPVKYFGMRSSILPWKLSVQRVWKQNLNSFLFLCLIVSLLDKFSCNPVNGVINAQHNIFISIKFASFRILHNTIFFQILEHVTIHISIPFQ